MLVIQTTWLGITGRKEICREIVIDKLKLFQQPPDNLKEHQLEPEEIPEEDPDEDAVEPTVDPHDSRARIKHILCKDNLLNPDNREDKAIYQEREGDWGTGVPQEDPRPPTQSKGTEGQTGPHNGIWGSGGPVVLREVTQGEGWMAQEVEGDKRQGDAPVPQSPSLSA